MKTSYMTVGAIVAALTAGTAVAQTPTPSPTPRAELSSSTSVATKGQWRSYKMIGLDVYNQSNEKIGDISELLVDQSGKIQTAILGVGGFLGVGERMVAVSFDQIKFVDKPVEVKVAMGSPTTTGSAGSTRPVRSVTEQWYPDHAVFNVTADQLKAMTEFKYN